MRKRSTSSNGRYRYRNDNKFDSRIEDNKRPRIRTPESQERSTDSDDSKGDEYGHFICQPGVMIKQNRYRVERELGKGTFGKVFRCFDVKRKCTFAIKIVRSVKKYINSAKIEAQILDEVYEAQKKRNVDLCVKMYANFRYDGNYYYKNLLRQGIQSSILCSLLLHALSSNSNFICLSQL